LRRGEDRAASTSRHALQLHGCEVALWTRGSVEVRLELGRDGAGLPAQFAAKALLWTPVALRAVMDACLPGDLTLARLVTHPPTRRGAVWDGRWVLPAFMSSTFTEDGTAGTAALRKALAAFRERPNGQVPQPADHVKTELRCALFLKTCLSAIFVLLLEKGGPMAGNSAEPGRSVTSKIVAILLTFHDGNEHSLTEIARLTCLPVSTAHRLVPSSRDGASWNAAA